jgi:hypothetical protein
MNKRKEFIYERLIQLHALGFSTACSCKYNRYLFGGRSANFYGLKTVKENKETEEGR